VLVLWRHARKSPVRPHVTHKVTEAGAEHKLTTKEPYPIHVSETELTLNSRPAFILCDIKKVSSSIRTLVCAFERGRKTLKGNN
jgi:hypothetical protein